MSDEEHQISDSEIRRRYEKLDREAKSGGYNLNPDWEFTGELIGGLLVNEKRYGYPSCPCRLAGGEHEKDLDIICPCYYRDPDLDEFGACYCALYVSDEVRDGKVEAEQVAERRPTEEERAAVQEKVSDTAAEFVSLPYPVWRCKVCGYLAARDQPPATCPICKAKRERFERFI